MNRFAKLNALKKVELDGLLDSEAQLSAVHQGWHQLPNTVAYCVHLKEGSNAAQYNKLFQKLKIGSDKVLHGATGAVCRVSSARVHKC